MLSSFWRRVFAKTRPAPRLSRKSASRRPIRPRLEALEDRTLLAAGDLDPTFGIGGTLVYNGTGGLPSLRYNARNSLAVQSDGKIVIADVSNQPNGFAVARLNADGSIDTTFGNGGFAAPPSVMLPNDRALAVAVQPDNKIIAVGTTGVGGGSSNFAVVRYNPDGSVDTSFGLNHNGLVPIDFYGLDDIADSVVIQANGRIVVGGNITRPVPGSATLRFMALARLNSDGLQDADFDADGKIVLNFGAQSGAPGFTDDQLNALALQPDGELIVAGSTDLTVRGTLPGAIDFVTPFSPILVTATNHQLRTGDHVIITGVGGVPEANGQFNVTVLDRDHFTLNGTTGNPSSSYILGTGRFIIGGDIVSASNTTPIVITTAQPNGMVTGDTVRISGVQGNAGANGTFKVTVIDSTHFQLDNSFGTGAGTGGQYIRPFRTNFALTRVHALDGTLDADFGKKGLVVTDFFASPNGNQIDGGDDTAFTVAVRNDGDIVAGGLTQQGDGGDNFGVAVYDRKGQLDKNFNLDGLVETDFSPDFSSGSLGKPFSTDQGFSLILQPDGKTLLAGLTTTNGTNDFAIARYNTDGSLDQTFGRHGLVVTGFGAGSQDEIRNIALQPGGILVAGLSNPGTGPQFTLARYQGFAFGTLQFNSPTYTVGGGYASATITVTRQNGSDGTVTVRFATSDGTARAGTNYIATSGQLTFAQGQTAQNITIPVINTNSGPVTFNVTLSNISGGAALGTPSVATVTVAPGTQPEQIQFSAPTFTVNENDGFAQITVSRVGDTSQTVSANFTTADGTGLNGRNYVATSGTLTFGPGETTKAIMVGLIADGQPGSDTNFTIQLTSPNGAGATLGPVNSTTVTIRETDIPGIFNFSQPVYTVPEGAGPFTITVTRTGTSGTATVDFFTANGTAVSGNQYQGTSGTLVFGPGQTTRTFTVNILQNNVVEGTKTFTVGLRNPSVGASVGTIPSAEVDVTETSVTPNERFVQQAYLDILGRPVDPSGLSNWTGYLSLGGTRAGVAHGLLASVEYRAHVVTGFFQKYLNRAPDQDGLNNFVLFLGAGGTQEQIQAVILGSPEYSQVHNAASNDAFLSQLYQDVLNRPIDAGGRLTFLQALAAGASRADVANTLLASTEYKTILVESYYQTFLGRPADSFGLNAYVSALQHGTRDEDIIQMFVASDEYFARL